MRITELNEGVIMGPGEDQDPMNPRVAVLGGAGSYDLHSLKMKARREANELAKDIASSEHGQTYRSALYHIKQLENTLKTIVAAHDELNAQRRRGGVKSRGIRDESVQ